jgi:hypothetical protein
VTVQLLGLPTGASAPEPAAGSPGPQAAGSIPLRAIKVDGDTADWDGLDPLFRDAVGDDGGQYAGTDIERVYLARDRRSLYVRFALAGQGLPARAREYRQALLAVNLMSGDYLLLAASYREGWRAAVHTWNPKTGKSAPLAFGAMARSGDGFEARFPMETLRGYLQEGKPYAISAKIGVASDNRYRDLDTTGPRFLNW